MIVIEGSSYAFWLRDQSTIIITRYEDISRKIEIIKPKGAKDATLM